ncbi:hydantoinase/oxoprolinase family protein [Sphingomonas sp. 35-24ZXX]|uniref:hydantoinase/oxoprolinase family protein n=1 Tax=Sphingomonas sp. 35-24ZXX TaxID=1545915 RepID=UPI00053C064F|nr:hydantoinase/oxoprolinase family protein [Sphingomonas sp. 35-24ZXX]
MNFRVGIDIGGTFTDFALLHHGEVKLHKNLSTPHDRSEGVLQGLQTLAEQQGLSLRDFLGACETIVHGTTIADNTLIEMNGAVTGLITTQGFRDEMAYRRGFKEDIWDVRLEPPVEIVPRRRRLTVTERIRADGSVHEPLDEASVREACRKLRLQKVESVAVSLLFSFLNPVHERRIASIIAEEMPGVAISLSHQILPRAPEYDRTSTTVVNAYVAPRVTHYLDRLVTRLADAGYPGQLMVMQASGGVMTREYIADAPVRVLASGPAGGVVGSAHVGRAKGCADLLCVDMGGTSYDMALVLSGQAPAEAGWNMHHRYLVGVPMIGVETLGAGGGSICQVHNSMLQVGPRSAGSEPGPICYGKGGNEPTVTDALLMLGILSTDEGFAGGGFRLSALGVTEAFGALGHALGYGAEQAAFDCWRLVNANMTNGVRRTTAGKGIDPRRLVMLAYGGNGPAFAATQAESLGIRRVLIPKASPTFSALGTLVADPTIDEERSMICSADRIDTARMSALWSELEKRAEAHFARAGYARAQICASYRVNMRYPGQNFTLSFELFAADQLGDQSFVGPDLASRAMNMFNARHLAEYGHVRDHEVPELTAVRLVSSVPTPLPPASGGSASEAAKPRPARTRRANLGEGFADTPVFVGPDLIPGQTIAGPAIIEERFTTIVVQNGWQALIDAAGDYELLKLPG